jgi:hypothetical protein
MLFLCGAAVSASAQARYRVIEEPRWLKLNVTRVSGGLYLEGERETTRFAGGSEASQDRLFVGPLVGLDLLGSIYHPNLCRLAMNSEGAFGWEHEVVDSTTSSTRDKFQYLGNFNANAFLFANQPYHGNIFGNYSHTYRDYDFFNRVTVDTWRYGAGFSYLNDPFTFNATYTHRDEDVSDLAAPSTSHEDTVGFETQHSREHGGTSLSYSFDRYSRTDFGASSVGDDQVISLGDSERFGDRRQFNFNNSLSYSLRETDAEDSRQFSARSDLNAQHLHHLSSDYDFNFDRYEVDGFTSDNFFGGAALHHQLYESLGSTLSLHAANYETDGEFSSGFTRRFGGGLAEDYTKRLGQDHRLRLSGSVILDHVETEGISRVENEPHNFSNPGGAPPGSVFLDQPNVIALTIVVTDQNDNLPAYVLGVDYGVLQNGTRTLIQRLAGSRIPVDATFLVDYRTVPTAPGSYETFTQYYEARVDLWNYLWGIYFRYTRSANNAPPELLVQDLSIYTLGTDLTWRWFRTGVEGQIYDSTESEYQSLSLYQSATFSLDAVSSLSANFSENWIDYLDADRSEQNFRFTSRYQRSFTSRLGFDLEGGVAIRRGAGVDQTLATARPSVQYRIGQTTINAGYNFEHEIFLENEERTKHFLFVKIARRF